MKRELCESAKKGKRCIDDLCHGAVTLCGFDLDLYEEITRESEEPEYQDEGGVDVTGKLWLCKVVGRAELDLSIETRKPYILQPLGEVILNENSGEARPNSEHLRGGGDSEM